MLKVDYGPNSPRVIPLRPTYGVMSTTKGERPDSTLKQKTFFFNASPRVKTKEDRGVNNRRTRWAETSGTSRGENVDQGVVTDLVGSDDVTWVPLCEACTSTCMPECGAEKAAGVLLFFSCNKKTEAFFFGSLMTFSAIIPYRIGYCTVPPIKKVTQLYRSRNRNGNFSSF